MIISNWLKDKTSHLVPLEAITSNNPTPDLVVIVCTEINRPKQFLGLAEEIKKESRLELRKYSFREWMLVVSFPEKEKDIPVIFVLKTDDVSSTLINSMMVKTISISVQA